MAAVALGSSFSGLAGQIVRSKSFQYQINGLFEIFTRKTAYHIPVLVTGPKHEIFDTEFSTQSKPVWIGDLENKQTKNKKTKPMSPQDTGRRL